MSLAVPEPFAARLATVASRLGVALTGDGLSKVACWETAAELEKLAGEVEGNVKSVEEVEVRDSTHHERVYLAPPRRSGRPATTTLLADLINLAARLARPPASTFPLEIVQQIIEDLVIRSGCEENHLISESRYDLEACTLVHSSWTPYAHPSLFRHCTIRGKQRADTCGEYFSNNEKLSSYVSGITLRAVRPSSSLLEHFHGLRELMLWKTEIDAKLLAGLQNLQALTLAECAPVLPALDSLQHLGLIGTSDLTDPFVFPTLPKLVSVTIHGLQGMDDISAGEVLGLLTQHQHKLRHLSILSLSKDSPARAAPFWHLLPTLDDLRCLQLAWDLDTPPPSFHNPPKLKHLRIMFHETDLRLLEVVRSTFIDASPRSDQVPTALSRIDVTLWDGWQRPYEGYTPLEAVEDELVRPDFLDVLEKRGVELRFVDEDD